MTHIYEDQHQPKREREFHGSRPSPLRINKDSHLIQKPSSSSSSSSSSSFSLPAAAAPPPKRHPVIIYTHSPKIIHTPACDFMALVQKLTGLNHSDERSSSPPPSGSQQPTHGGNSNKLTDDKGSSSTLTDENSGEFQVSSSLTTYDPSQNPFFSDVPLFTPNSSEFFCSPRNFFRFPDPIFSPANLGNSVSSPVFEAMKGFPEY